MFLQSMLVRLGLLKRCWRKISPQRAEMHQGHHDQGHVICECMTLLIVIRLAQCEVCASNFSIQQGDGLGARDNVHKVQAGSENRATTEAVLKAYHPAVQMQYCPLVCPFLCLSAHSDWRSPLRPPLQSLLQSLQPYPHPSALLQPL